MDVILVKQRVAALQKILIIVDENLALLLRITSVIANDCLIFASIVTETTRSLVITVVNRSRCVNHLRDKLKKTANDYFKSQIVAILRLHSVTDIVQISSVAQLAPDVNLTL